MPVLPDGCTARHSAWAKAAGGLATSLTTEQLIREAQASREPVWAHESLLPLWLVGLYEERVGAGAPASAGQSGKSGAVVQGPRGGGA